MTKTDKSKHNICIAAIKRSTIKPYNFELTKFYEPNNEFPYSGLDPNLREKEMTAKNIENVTRIWNRKNKAAEK